MLQDSCLRALMSILCITRTVGQCSMSIQITGYFSHCDTVYLKHTLMITSRISSMCRQYMKCNACHVLASRQVVHCFTSHKLRTASPRWLQRACLICFYHDAATHMLVTGATVCLCKIQLTTVLLHHEPVGTYNILRNASVS